MSLSSEIISLRADAELPLTLTGSLVGGGGGFNDSRVTKPLISGVRGAILPV